MFAYANGDTSVVVRGLDELGNPTAGTFSITESTKEYNGMHKIKVYNIRFSFHPYKQCLHMT